MKFAAKRAARHLRATVPWLVCASVLCAAALGMTAHRAAAQGTPPRTGRAATDTTHLPPIGVSATRSNLARDRVPGATALVQGAGITRGHATLGLDESLGAVPGVYVANRYNFSLDQRISIRGFGARSAFAVRGITVLMDGIPQTLPDGQGQLTNIELGATDRIEVLRGPSSSLFGNAAGGVISIWTDPVPPRRAASEVRVDAGAPADGLDRGYAKWLSRTRLPVGNGVVQATASRLAYTGQRPHGSADLRKLDLHLALPLGVGWTIRALFAAADNPRADNPGAITLAEFKANPDTVEPVYTATAAGKAVRQLQGGVTLQRDFAGGGTASITTFGLGRDLRNPQTFAYIDLNRTAFGVRALATRPVTLAGVPQTLTAGIDAQWQRDDRANFANQAGQAAPPTSLDQLEQVSTVGPFLRSVLSLGPRTSLTGGVRYDRTRFAVQDRLVGGGNPDDSGHRLMDALSGTGGLTVQVSDAATLYATVGTSFQTPTTTELANRPDTAGGFNAELSPQTATIYEVGARGNLGMRWAYSLALYQVAVRGELVAFEVTSSPGRQFYRNSGRSRHRGLEAGVHGPIAPGTSLTLNWTQSDFRYTSYLSDGRDLAGRRLPGVPAAWIDALLHTAPAAARGGWLDAELRHASAYPVDDTLDLQTAPWTTLDLRAGWNGAVRGTTVRPYIGVSNLFDRRYVSSVVINAARGRYFEPAPGRTFAIGMSILVGS